MKTALISLGWDLTEINDGEVPTCGKTGNILFP